MPPVVAWKRVVIENYAEYQGRAARPEFWWYYLANVIIVMVIALLGALISAFVSILIVIVYSLAVLMPTISVAIRRLHDSGKSGWFLLLAFVPIANLVVLVFYVLPGTSGPNTFGPEADPLPRG